MASADIGTPSAAPAGSAAASVFEDRRAAPIVRSGTLAWAAAIVLGFFGLFGLSAVTAPLDSAAIARGEVAVEGGRQSVQHLTGGLVSEIHVQEGSQVGRGDPLVTLDEAQAAMTWSILGGRLSALRALSSRLRAERDGRDAVTFDFDDGERVDPTVQDLIAGQTRIFDARARSIRSQRLILERRVGQLQAEIKGLEGQLLAHADQDALIDLEIANVEPLVDKGLEREPRLLALRRVKAEVARNSASAWASIARSEQAIGETQLRIQDLEVSRLNEVVQELRAVDDEMFDIRERLRNAQATLDRTVIRAPVAGTVVDLRVFTEGGVIGAGEEIMSLVPSDAPLQVEARIALDDIDAVRVGLPARVRLTAFSQRTVDVVTGTVSHVSADRLTDPTTGEAYFLAQIRLDDLDLPGEIAEQVVPGMGVEVMVRTGERTIFDYLTKPLRDSFSRALVEE